MKRLLLFVLIIMGFCGRFASDAKRCPVAQVVVQSLRKAGTMTVSVKMEGKATPYVVTIQSVR